MTNFARSSLALVLRAFFGGAKSCALVNIFMICLRWSASGQLTTTKFWPWMTAISWLQGLSSAKTKETKRSQFRMTTKLGHETYLGDGIYASFDGWYIILRALRVLNLKKCFQINASAMLIQSFEGASSRAISVRGNREWSDPRLTA
jgi:hypothetical protein